MKQHGNINNDIKIGVDVFVRERNCWDRIVKISEDNERAETSKGFVISRRGYVEIWDSSS